MRYAIWAAVSTEAQAGEDKDSLDNQVRDSKKTGDAKGWSDTHLRYIVPGKSRTRWVNLRDAENDIPPLRTMLEDAKAGRFDLLLMWDYNRLRDLLDPVAKSLSNYGVQLYSVNQPIEPIAPEEFSPYATDSESMMRGMNQIISRWQIADLRRKYRYGVKARVDRGLPSLKVPYGYMKPPGREQETKVIPVINPAQAVVVVEIKNKYLEGASIKTICDYLTERYPTPSGISAWSRQTVRKILSNPFYAGKVVFGRRLTVNDTRNNIKKLVSNPTPYMQPGAHQPLYSWTEHLAIMAEFDRRKDIPTLSRYPWSGMLHCAECGGRLRRKFDGKAGRYSCLHCYKVQIRDDDIRSVIPSAIQAALRAVPAEDDLTNHHVSSDAAILDLDKQRKRIQQAYESGIYSIQEAEGKIKDLEAKIKKLRDTELQVAKQAAERDAFRISLDEAQELLDDLPEWMLDDDPKEVNRLLLRLIKQVNITQDGKAIPILRG